MKIRKLMFTLWILFIIGGLFSEVKQDVIKSKANAEILKPEKTINFDEDSPVMGNFIITHDKMFFVNPMEKLLYICDLDGNEIKMVDGRGKGPGEFSMPTKVFDDKKNNSVGIVDQMNRRTSYFDYDGNHIKDVKFEYTKIPIHLKYIGDDKVLFFMGVEVNREKGTVMSKPTIELIKKDTTITLFSSSFNPMNMNIGNSKIPIFEVSKDRIYISKMNPENYEIFVYDKNGKQIEIIKKKVKKVKRPQKEIDEIEARLEQTRKQVKAAGSKMKMNFSGYQYAYFVNNLLVDSDENLWVYTLDKDGAFFDVINKDGKVIKKVKLADNKTATVKIYKDKLYEFSGNEDDGYKLDIYKIK